jgi:serine/threonine-protein kinase RsbW
VNARPITSLREQARLDLRVQSDPANLAAVRKAVEALAAENGFDADAVSQVGLCVNEAMANIIRHAYEGRTDRPMHLKAWIDPKGKELVVTIRDWGNGVDPSTVPCRPYDPLEPGGVGLICLGQWMDEIQYTPQKDGILTTMKRRKSRA